MKIFKFDSLESTNTYLKNHINDYQNHDVIFTCKQTNGKGRTNRVWTSDEKSLTFSILFKDEYLYENYESLSLISAVSVFEILKEYLPNLKIKWPNDLLVNDKKICGILLESRISNQMEGLILGIGINVNNSFFDPSLNATSLYLETNILFDIEELLKRIINQLINNISLLKNDNSNHINIINQNNYLLNKEAYAVINNIKKKVIVLNILQNNHLLVKYNDKLIEVSTDEISFHKD